MSKFKFSVGLVWFGLVWFGMVWFGLVLFGTVWFGLVWFGMVWLGLGWCGKQRQNPYLFFFVFLFGLENMVNSSLRNKFSQIFNFFCRRHY